MPWALLLLRDDIDEFVVVVPNSGYDRLTFTLIYLFHSKEANYKYTYSLLNYNTKTSMLLEAHRTGMISSNKCRLPKNKK